MQKLVLLTWLTASLVAPATGAAQAKWNPRKEFIKALVSDVPEILKKQDPATGRFQFGEPWICDDQNVIFRLAVAWSTSDPANPSYHDRTVLEAVMKGGDALIAAQDKQGAWEFRKRDNSYWGQSAKPWTYSRWVRAFSLIKDAMPDDRRKRWEAGLTLGFRHIAPWLEKTGVQNIPCHHAMALYCAGVCFGREDWKTIATQYMNKVSGAQAPEGYWTEHSGPVVTYNAVYVDALGAYFSMSHDTNVIECLRRSAAFHRTFTYPDGSNVETVDERNPYHRGAAAPNLGFSFTPEGRALLIERMKFLNWKVDGDSAANFLLHGATGPATTGSASRELIVVGKNDALVLHRGPWFVCLSAYVCPQSTSRWIQDRQNFVSIYHEKAGLILGGGNTKLQPLWSTFTVGDITGLRQKPGDENPDFLPKGDLIHVPSRSQLQPDERAPRLNLTYGKEECSLAVETLNDQRVKITLAAIGKTEKPSESHLTFLPPRHIELRTARSASVELTESPLSWSAAEIGPWFQLGNVRITAPLGAKLIWPARRHDPYKKDGRSGLDDARLVLCVPLSSASSKQEVVLEIQAAVEPQ